MKTINKATILLFLIMIFSNNNVFCQNKFKSKSLKYLKSNRNNLKKTKLKISDSLKIIDDKIDSLNHLIANAKVEFLNKNNIILEINENTKLYEFESTLSEFKARLYKGDKVLFKKVESKNFLKVKYQNKVGYVNKYYLKNQKKIKKIYSAAIQRGDIEAEKTRLDYLSEIYGEQKAKKILSKGTEFADLVLSYGISAATKLKSGVVWIGMSKNMASYVLGAPDDKNITRGSWGTNEQWVYNSGKYKYLYFEDGQLTSIQR